MTSRARKLVGTILILFWIPIYALLAMAVAIRVLPRASGLIVFCYYFLAGTVWIIPVGLMLPWMHREPAERPKPALTAE